MQPLTQDQDIPEFVKWLYRLPRWVTFVVIAAVVAVVYLIVFNRQNKFRKYGVYVPAIVYKVESGTKASAYFKYNFKGEEYSGWTRRHGKEVGDALFVKVLPDKPWKYDVGPRAKLCQLYFDWRDGLKEIPYCIDMSERYNRSVEGCWQLQSDHPDFPTLIFNKDSTAVFTSMIDTVFDFQYRVQPEGIRLRDIEGRQYVLPVLQYSIDSFTIFNSVTRGHILHYKRIPCEQPVKQ